MDTSQNNSSLGHLIQIKASSLEIKVLNEMLFDYLVPPHKAVMFEKAQKTWIFEPINQSDLTNDAVNQVVNQFINDVYFEYNLILLSNQILSELVFDYPRLPGEPDKNDNKQIYIIDQNNEICRYIIKPNGHFKQKSTIIEPTTY